MKKLSPSHENDISTPDNKTLDSSPTAGIKGVWQDRKQRIRLLFSLLLSGLLLFLVYRSMDMATLRTAFARGEVQWWIIIVSIFVEAFANYIRGLRWQLLMIPFSSPPPRKLNAALASMGCYTVNMLFPRAGEVWRCSAIARYEGLPFSPLLGSLFMDRLMDFVAMLLIFFGALVVFYDFLATFFVQHPDFVLRVEGFLSSPATYIGVGVVILGLGLFVFIARRYAFWSRIQRELSMMLEGLRSVRSMPRPGLFVLYTVFMWVCYFYAFYMTFWAFDFTRSFGYDIGLLAFVMGTLGIAAPVQSGIGAWHFMVISTLVAFGVSRDEAGLFALIVHTTQTFGTAIIGLFAILILPLLNRKYNRTIDKTIWQKIS